MSALDLRDLKVGDKVRLTGPAWGEYRGREVTVDHFIGVQAWSNDPVINSLTALDGFSYDGVNAGYSVEPVDAIQDLREGLMAFNEQFADIAATVAGAAKQLEDQGFTPEQARAIVAGLFARQGMAG